MVQQHLRKISKFGAPSKDISKILSHEWHPTEIFRAGRHKTYREARTFKHTHKMMINKHEGRNDTGRPAPDARGQGDETIECSRGDGLDLQHGSLTLLLAFRKSEMKF